MVDIRKGVIIDDFDLDCQWDTDLYDNAQKNRRRGIQGFDLLAQ